MAEVVLPPGSAGWISKKRNFKDLEIHMQDGIQRDDYSSQKKFEKLKSNIVTSQNEIR